MHSKCIGGIQWKGAQDLRPDKLHELDVAAKTPKWRVVRVVESRARCGKKSN
jgi:hypothetical protein